MIVTTLWILAVVFASLAGAVFLIRHTMMWYATTWRHRHIEKPTAGLGLAACPQCGGEWTKWDSVDARSLPLEPMYPSISSKVTVHSQTRRCRECGLADRRVF